MIEKLKKRGRGRPLSSPGAERPLVGKLFYMDVKDWARAKAVAEEKGVSLNSFIRDMVLSKLDRLSA